MCAVSGIQDTSSLQYRQLGFILAGGLSSRMGQDKATVSVNGQAMLDTARQLLDTAPLHQHYVLGGPFSTFAERTPQHGPGRAIADVLLQLMRQCTGTALFLPVDMPCLSTDSINILLETASSAKRTCYFADSFLPVAIPITPRYERALAELIKAKPCVSIRAVLAMCDAQSLPFTGNSKELVNVNTRVIANSLSA